MQYEYTLGDTLAQAHHANRKRKEGIPRANGVELDDMGQEHTIPLAAYAIKDKVIGLRPQVLDDDFAGRVLKLEMQFEKGIDHVSLDDVDNLMNLYMEAVQYFNSAKEVDKQNFYQKKLQRLLDS